MKPSAANLVLVAQEHNMLYTTNVEAKDQYNLAKSLIENGYRERDHVPIDLCYYGLQPMHFTVDTNHKTFTSDYKTAAQADEFIQHPDFLQKLGIH